MAAPDYDQNDVAVQTPAYRVFHRPAYDTGSWTAQPNIDVWSIVDGANAITQIVLHYKTGNMLRETLSDFTQVDSLDWANEFVMVEVYASNDDGTPNFSSVITRWIGIITPDDREALGYLEGVGFAYDQTMLALGLETLLDESIVYGSYVKSLPVQGTGTSALAVHVDTPITFNAPRNGPYRWFKNMSASGMTKRYVPSEDGDGSTDVATPDATFCGEAAVPVFDQVGTSTKSWTISKILGYLLAFYGPSLGGKPFRLKPIAASGTDADLVASLLNFEVVGFNVERRSLFECLNELLRAERGLGWAVQYDDAARAGTDAPIILVFSISAGAISAGSWSLPAASIKKTIDITGRRDASWQIRRDPLEQYGTIRVRGAPTLACFSISQPDGSLDKGWLASELTEYNAPPDVGTSDTDFALDQRKRDYRAKSRVWTEYVLKDQWDFKAKNGEGAGTAALVNPRLDANGDFPGTEVAGSRSLFEKRFESFVPIEVERDAAATDDPTSPQYKEPIVVYKTTDGDWIDLVHHKHPTGLHCTTFHVLNDRPGVKIRCEPNHALAGSSHPPDDLMVFPTDWQKFIITVAMRLDRRVAVAEVIDETVTRTLVIDLDDAEFWFIAAGTVTAVTGQRALTRQGTTRKIVRDDRDRLRRTLALAKAWYGQERRPIALQFKSLQFRLAAGGGADLRIGIFVNKLVDGGESDDVNTVITRRKYDFRNNTTSIEMGYSLRPDFQSLN